MTKKCEQEIPNMFKNKFSSTNIKFSSLNSQKLINNFHVCHFVVVRIFFLYRIGVVYCLALKINWCHSNLWQFNRVGFKSNFTTILNVKMENEIEIFLFPTIKHCLKRGYPNIGTCNNIHQISLCMMERHSNY
jgi:hypothetical protein